MIQTEKRDPIDEDPSRIRRSIHDLAAALISVRALAETLAEHVPLLLAISRSQSQVLEAQIPTRTLDALPSIPTEIMKLCDIANMALKTISDGQNRTEKPSEPHDSGMGDHQRAWSIEKANGEGAEILLVEDEETVRYVLEQTLAKQGCCVTSAADGEEALRLLDEQEFDLVIMDLRIPGMSGWETAERIRQRELGQGRHTRIVGLTASPLLEDQRRAKAAGMDAVLVKPVQEAALQSVLRRLTRASSKY